MNKKKHKLAAGIQALTHSCIEKMKYKKIYVEEAV